MSVDLQGKVALVTGAASGIGRAIAAHMARCGARVLATDIDTESGQMLAEEIGEACLFQPLDIASEESWASCVEAAKSRFQGLDILVNNAAISKPGSIESVSVEAWRETLDVNATGTFLGCREAMRAMHDTGGAIVNIASARGKRISASQLSYSCSKALVIRLTEGVALHCAEQGLPIRCNAVCPGVVDTPILANAYEALGGREAAVEFLSRYNATGRLGTVEEIAAVVSFLACDEASFMTGAIVDVDGGFRIRDR